MKPTPCPDCNTPMALYSNATSTFVACPKCHRDDLAVYLTSLRHQKKIPTVHIDRYITPYDFIFLKSMKITW